MSKSNVVELLGREGVNDPLTELLRSGAQTLISQAVEAELQVLLESIRTAEPNRAMRGLSETATCQSASYRQGLGR